MMRSRYGLALLLIGLSGGGCADLPQVQENSCGNGLVELGEDCDGQATKDGKDCSADTDTCACRQPGEVNECRFRCDRASDCPDDERGWGCGIDHVCRRPRICKGAVCDRWQSAAIMPESATQLSIADFDGSGRGSVLSVASPLVSIHSFDETGRLLDSDVLVVPDAAPSVGNLTSADPANPDDLYPINDFVVDVSRGLEVFRGSSEGGVEPTVYASQSLPVLGRAQAFSYLDGSLHGPTVLFFPVGPDGKTSSVQGFESGSSVDVIASIPGGGGRLAGDAVVAPFFNAMFPPFPCEQFAVTFEEAKGVRVYSPCKIDGTANVEGSAGYVQPTNIALPPGASIRKGVQGLFRVDADGDDIPDLVIAGDDAGPGPGALFLSFSRGDGSFHSSPDKAVPANNQAALYPVNTPLAQPEQVRKHLLDPVLAVGDINGDCAIDFVNGFGVYMSEVGKGSCFKPESFFTLSIVEDEHVWTSAAVADFSADGLLDVMVGSAVSPGMTFYKGTGTLFLNPFKLATQSGVKNFVTGDFDGDFVLDLAFTQGADADDEGTPRESLAVVFGGIAGGPTQPVVMGESRPFQQLLATNVLGIYPDFITDLLALAKDETGDGLELSLFPGNGGRLLEAPYYLIDIKTTLPDFPSQTAVGQFDDDPHHDIAAFGRQLCFAEKECKPRLWLVPTVGDAEIAPAGGERSPVATPLPLVDDGLGLEDIQAGALLAAVNLGPGGSGALDTDELVVVTGGSPPLLYVATAGEAGWAIAPKQALKVLGNAKLRELGVTVAELDGKQGPEVIVSSRAGVLVLWNRGTGTLDAEGDHATFLSADDIGAAACEGVNASAPILAIGSIASDADDPRELIVLTGQATYLLVRTREKLVPVCQKGLHGGNAVAGGDVNGDGVDDLVIGRKGSVELFIAEPAPAGPDLSVRQ